MPNGPLVLDPTGNLYDTTFYGGTDGLRKKRCCWVKQHFQCCTMCRESFKAPDPEVTESTFSAACLVGAGHGQWQHHAVARIRRLSSGCVTVFGNDLHTMSWQDLIVADR